MIEEKIKDYFHRFSDLRILFFFDEEKEYLEEVKGLDLSDIHIEYWQNTPFSLKVKLLGELPLQKSIREEMDKGTPTVSENPESPVSMVFREIARKMAATLSMRKKDYSSAFPKIVIQND